MRRRAIPLALLALSACRGEPARSPAIQASLDGAGGSDAGTEYAPYFYTWGWGNASYPFTGLADLEAQTGLRAVTLAFVLADGGCAATGEVPRHLKDVNAFRKRGGKVRASFGGAAGTYLESACPDAPALTEALRAFVDRTGVVDLDFDLEQPRALSPAVNRTRALALLALQSKRRVRVGFTLAGAPHDPKAAAPGGLSPAGLDAVRASVAAGVAVSYVNVMTMGYVAAAPAGRGRPMIDLAISALSQAKAQLQSVVPALGDAEAWAMLGVTPMIGDNGHGFLPFTLADAAALSSFARQRHLGLVSFWAINRDQPGIGLLSHHSRMQPSAFAFHKVFETATH